jgi:hypothetical protein
MLLSFGFHRRGAESAEINFSWSDFLRGEIRPNYLPEESNPKKIWVLREGF